MKTLVSIRNFAVLYSKLFEVLSQSLFLSQIHEMASVHNGDYKRYFVPGFGISRHIIFSHIHFYLGPYASVRPYSYQGREGYLVIAPGLPLTKVSL